VRLLIADDETNIRQSISRYFALSGIETAEAKNGLSAQKLLQEEAFDGAIFDLKMPGMTGLELLEWLQEEGRDLPVIMISAYGEVEDAVAAMKAGAADYVVKPFDPEDLQMRILRAVESESLRRQAEVRSAGESVAETQSPKLLEVYRIAERVAPTESSVLITGESGTGKEVLARKIHALSDRRDGPFVAINVGGIPENLLESELFGHERGSFTGAEARKRGMFEVATGGTLFLDEIGEMPLPLQVKLLRVLQDRRIQRLGATTSIPIDIRLIAATNADLKQRISDGSFREDLFYRLNVIHLHLPPLRERPEDIPVLVGHFLGKLRGRGGVSVSGIDTEAIRMLQSYPFPGNVRELENIVERAAILTDSETLRAADFAFLSGGPVTADPEPAGSLRDLEKRAIIAALRRHEGKRQATSDELGITRRTLLNKIKEYGLRDEI
jgi:two-component system, NtrC family, response regulator AtoC